MASAKRSRTEVAGPHQPGEDEATHQIELVLDDPSLLEPPLCLPAPLVDFCRSSGDILLVCKGGKALQCHSQMLACTSDVLRGMLHLTNTGNANHTHKPTRIPLPHDDAEEWLQVLVYLYPLVVVLSASDMTALQAMAAAVLAHKYNMPGLAALANNFISTFQGEDPNVGHLKCVVADFKNATSRLFSSKIKMAGHDWRFRIDSCVEADTKVSVTLIGQIGSADVSVSHFSVAIVSHTDPVEHTYVAPPEDVVTMRQNGFASCRRRIDMDGLEDASRGLMRDGSVELQVVFELRIHDECEEGRFFSSHCTSDFYVFKWLQLAGKIKHAELEAKCLEFIDHHAYYAVFSKAFAADLHAAFTRMSPGQMYTCLRKMAPHVV